jgi:predicted alternative tryptophan synthase beta-subunit
LNPGEVNGKLKARTAKGSHKVATQAKRSYVKEHWNPKKITLEDGIGQS